MHYCPTCGRDFADAVEAHDIARPIDRAALAALRPKVAAMLLAVDGWSDVEFGDWVNGLPFAEFIEFIGLDTDRLGDFAGGWSP